MSVLHKVGVKECEEGWGGVDGIVEKGLVTNTTALSYFDEARQKNIESFEINSCKLSFKHLSLC
jgi:hypothetical protein